MLYYIRYIGAHKPIRFHAQFVQLLKFVIVRCAFYSLIEQTKNWNSCLLWQRWNINPGLISNLRSISLDMTTITLCSYIVMNYHPEASSDLNTFMSAQGAVESWHRIGQHLIILHILRRHKHYKTRHQIFCGFRHFLCSPNITLWNRSMSKILGYFTRLEMDKNMCSQAKH